MVFSALKKYTITTHTGTSGLQIEGVLAYFTHLKCQKRIGDDVGNVGYVFTNKNKKNFVMWK
jgi:hypothetical protein